MLRTIHGDDARFAHEYWQRIPDVYFAGDDAQCDKDGDLWLLGRVDDIIKSRRTPAQFDLFCANTSPTRKSSQHLGSRIARHALSNGCRSIHGCHFLTKQLAPPLSGNSRKRE
jgi:hypothetical protein